MCEYMCVSTCVRVHVCEYNVMCCVYIIMNFDLDLQEYNYDIMQVGGATLPVSGDGV